MQIRKFQRFSASIEVLSTWARFLVGSIALILILEGWSALAIEGRDSKDEHKESETSGPEKPAQIVIGITPGGDPQLIRSQSLELAKDLQNELDIPINIYISKNYAGLVGAMKSKKIDFGFFSTLTYISAEREAYAKVLLKKVYKEPFYYSALVVRGDSKIHTVGELKGQRIAFVDNQSASGFLYPWLILKKNNLKKSDFSEVFFSGNHHASIEMLEAKKADVVAVFSDDQKSKTGAWTKFAKDSKSKFRIIWTSDPIPNDPFCVRSDFYDRFPRLTHTLMFSLIDLFEKGQKKKKYSEVLGLQTLIPATTRQYESVREVVKVLGVELNLN